jgi:hypothetical protein
MSETHSTDTRSAYPWFGFEHTHQARDGVSDSQIADGMTLGNLLDRYALACRKHQPAAEGLDEFSDAAARGGDQPGKSVPCGS